MQNAETILGIIQERGRKGLPLEELYRQLYNRDLYLCAYNRLYRNDGAMTPGVTEETVDEMSLQKIDNIIDAVRHERYRWSPARRVYIEKKNDKKKKRSLGLPTWSSKLVGEVIRSLLDAYYEPQFSQYSHGFRPNRGCHTALGEIVKRWTGISWFIEGDISRCFDSLDQEILLSILSEKIYDNRFLGLIANSLKAGYLENWKYHETLSGVPTGTIVGPIFSNIYMDKLDQFVEKNLLPAYNRGINRKRNPAYELLRRSALKEKKAGNYEEAKQLRKQAQQLPSRDPHDPDYRRLRYLRYADDWLCGFRGPRKEAEEIKHQIAEFLQKELKLELSQEKTLITSARSGVARFLGYDITILQDNSKQHPRRHQRCINGTPGLMVPSEVIRKKSSRYLRGGKPIHRAEMINDTDFSIIARYQAEYRGVVNFYLMAFNVRRLASLYYVMQTSLLKTLAAKYKISVNEAANRYKKSINTSHGPYKVVETTWKREEDKRPLVTHFGGIPLRWKKSVVLDDQPKQVFNSGRSELIQRLLADTCELCGSQGRCEVHHIHKLADIDKPGRKEKPPWVKLMIARRRKTLIVCWSCHHEKIHGKQSQ